MTCCIPDPRFYNESGLRWSFVYEPLLYWEVINGGRGTCRQFDMCKRTQCSGKFELSLDAIITSGRFPMSIPLAYSVGGVKILRASCSDHQMKESKAIKNDASNIRHSKTQALSCGVFPTLVQRQSVFCILIFNWLPLVTFLVAGESIASQAH
jgi:hypothetical protein